MYRYLLALLLVAAACGDDTGASSNAGNADTNAETSANATTNNLVANNSSVDAGNNDTTTDAGSNDTDMGPVEIPEVLAEGTDRETPVFLPADYEPTGSYPLVVLLHGYSASGLLQDAYFGISDERDEYGFIFLRPDGTVDQGGQRFWNATEYCCDIYNTGIDDEAYLMGLIEEAKQKLAVDPARVYLIGHSNGGFMSYRLSCNHGDSIAAMVSLAGANFTDPDNCLSDTPVAVAQVHGTADATILYPGAALYPSAEESVLPWAQRNGCDSDLSDTGESLDLDTAVLGDETSIEEHANCDSGFSVELWTMTASGHIPGMNDDWASTALDFLYEHSR